MSVIGVKLPRGELQRGTDGIAAREAEQGAAEVINLVHQTSVAPPDPP
jgi:hypothetical protein